MSLSRIRKLGAIALLGVLAITSAVAEDVAPRFEADLIFPRNDTYTTSDVFPISFAFQNLTAPRSFGVGARALWVIQAFRDGRIPTGVDVDEGEFDLLSEANEENNGSFIYVANSNVTGWIERKRNNPGERYLLQLYIYWEKNGCESLETAVLHSMFSIEAPWEQAKDPEHELWVDGGHGVAPDIMDVPQCPVPLYVAEMRQNSTVPSCPVVEEADLESKANPCAVNLDENTKKSIASRASSLAATSATPTPTSEVSSQPKPDSAAHGVGAPLGLALVAAWVLGALRLVY